MRYLLFVFALSVTGPLVHGAELSELQPAAAGFSPERFERVGEVARKYVENGRASGIVTQMSREGGIVYSNAIGTLGFDNDAPMRDDSLFRIYSMTKAVTAVAALILYEEGHFQLYDPVSRYLPAFENLQVFKDGELRPPRRTMTIHQLFTHMSGMGYGYPEGHPVRELIEYPDVGGAKDLGDFAERIAGIPLLFEPGTDWEYSFATDVLGAVVENVSGKSLGEFFQARIFAPLGMRDTAFAVPASKLGRLTSLHEWDADSEQATVVSGPPFDAPVRVSPVDSGGGGLISTARDYMRFLEMLRRGGMLDGNRILGPKTVAFMMKDHLPRSLTEANVGPDADLTLGLGGSHALGLGIYADPVRRGVLSSPGEIEWGGAAGTIYWWDPVEDIIVVVMRQLRNSPDSLRFRDDFSVAIYQALIDIQEDTPYVGQ